MKKGLYYQVWPRQAEAVTTWNSIDFAIHSHKRRVLNHAFSSKALRSAEPFVLSNADRWCELLDQEVSAGGEWSGSCNMTDWVNYLVFDILGDLCFGKSFNMKEPDGPMKEAPHLMADMLTLLNPVRAHSLSCSGSRDVTVGGDSPIPDCLRALYRTMGLAEAKRPGLAPRRGDTSPC